MRVLYEFMSFKMLVANSVKANMILWLDCKSYVRLIFHYFFFQTNVQIWSSLITDSFSRNDNLIPILIPASLILRKRIEYDLEYFF